MLKTVSVTCIWCNQYICDINAKQWPPLFNGKRVFSRERLWDESLFHTIYDHYSQEIVAVHNDCKIEYYRSTGNGGRAKADLTDPQHCPNCNLTCPIQQFYLDDNDKLCHGKCDAALCLWCNKPFGRSKKIVLAKGYEVHGPCSLIFCVTSNYRYRNKETHRHIDVDRFWPANLTKQTCRNYPAEFISTIRTFVLCLYRLKLKHLVPTDIVLHIMAKAMSPMNYPIQNGFDLRVCPTVKGYPCRKCEKPTALTRFDKGYCSTTECLTFTNQTCHYGHAIKRILTGCDDCTGYRCRSNAKCSQCRGPIRYAIDTSVEWCRRDLCMYMEKQNCHCGRRMYKTVSPAGLPLLLTTEQCCLEKCAYFLIGKSCSCGEPLYISSLTWFSCVIGKCNSNKKIS